MHQGGREADTPSAAKMHLLTSHSRLSSQQALCAMLHYCLPDGITRGPADWYDSHVVRAIVVIRPVRPLTLQRSGLTVVQVGSTRLSRISTALKRF